MKVLVLCIADPSTNPRPARAVRMCADAGYQVDTFSYALKGDLPAGKRFTIPAPSQSLTAKIYRKLIKSVRPFCLVDRIFYGHPEIENSIKRQDYDLLIVEDLYLLPLAFRCKGHAKVIFDAREYYPAQREDSAVFRMLEKPYINYLCRRFLKQCDAVLTVSMGIVEEYRKQFGIECHLIISVPSYIDTYPKSSGDQILMVHHGIANANRKLENMINLFKTLDKRFVLDMYLVGNDQYVSYLKKLAEGDARIRFVEPVSFKAIGDMLSKYDIGLYLLEPTGFNVKHALPNKFFEFIQARLMIAIGPSPDMGQLIHQYQCGIVSKSFSPGDLAEQLNALTAEDIDRYKQGSHQAAQDLCWEKEKIKYLEIINRVTA